MPKPRRKRTSRGPLKSDEQAEHLAPDSERSLKDQVKSRNEVFERPIPLYTNEHVLLDGHQYHSLPIGRNYLANGAQFISWQTFVEWRSEEWQRRKKRKVLETRNADAALRTRTYDVPVPLFKETISHSGLHDYIFKALDKAGHDVGSFIVGLALELPPLWNDCDERTICLAVQVHPEAGSLHHHLETTPVGDDGFYVGPATVGSQKTPRADPGLIGELRLIRDGFQTDPVVIESSRADLEERSAASGFSPPDFILSMLVDQRTEEYLAELEKDKKLAAIIAKSREEYAAKVKVNLLLAKLENEVHASLQAIEVLKALSRQFAPTGELIKHKFDKAVEEQTYREKFESLALGLKPTIDRVGDIYITMGRASELAIEQIRREASEAKPKTSAKLKGAEFADTPAVPFYAPQKPAKQKPRRKRETDSPKTNPPVPPSPPDPPKKPRYEPGFG